MIISEPVLSVLSEAIIDGNVLRLNTGRLERKLYTDTDKILAAIGGKWDRKQKGHVFNGDPTERVEIAIITGHVEKKDGLGFFPTPPDLARQVCELANINKGHLVLEPSAGLGGLADIAALHANGKEFVSCVEIQDEHSDVLEAKGYRVIRSDFMRLCPNKDGLVDRVVMNPPFSAKGSPQADIDHVLHALDFLKSGGRLVSIMSRGIAFRGNKKTIEFLKVIDAMGGEIKDNPDGSFKAAGTDVKTVTVAMVKQ